MSLIFSAHCSILLWNCGDIVRDPLRSASMLSISASFLSAYIPRRRSTSRRELFAESPPPNRA
ncbi:MAG: hypothetical protein IKP73_00090 [Bacteroidales bacterium]|nr:hypothetical protein [Bacteroidales bacterium]